MSYAFDKSGNVQNITDTSDKPMSQSFEYDDLYQLTYAKGYYENPVDYDEMKHGSYTQNFTYDSIGNMTHKDSYQVWMPDAAENKHSLNYSFDYFYEDGAPHRATTIGDSLYEYDRNGNVTAKISSTIEKADTAEVGETFNGLGDKDTIEEITKATEDEKTNNGVAKGLQDKKPGIDWDLKKHPLGGPPGLVDKDKSVKEPVKVTEEYKWNSENRLTQFKEDGRTVDFLYNSAGERTVKRGQSGETIYADKFTQYQNKNTITKHIFVGETRVVTRLSQAEYFDINYEESNVYYYHSDHLGSTSYVSDFNGNEFEHMIYTPYGESWIDEGSNKDIIGYRFTSKELDDETGLYYYGARYLDPQTSRWMSVDPAGAELINPMRDGFSHIESNNWYSYVGNNPVMFTDPTGLEGTDVHRGLGVVDFLTLPFRAFEDFISFEVETPENNKSDNSSAPSASAKLESDILEGTAIAEVDAKGGEYSKSGDIELFDGVVGFEGNLNLTGLHLNGKLGVDNNTITAKGTVGAFEASLNGSFRLFDKELNLNLDLVAGGGSLGGSFNPFSGAGDIRTGVLSYGWGVDLNSEKSE